MFESTRIRLTAWYLLIIMSVSLLFSVIIYRGINEDLVRFEEIAEIIQEREELGFPPPRQFQRVQFDPELIQAARARLITTLGLLNLGILVLAGGAGYFLAGRTLRPIQAMVAQLNRFVSDASHELRTPLTSLRSEMEVGLLDKNLTLPKARQLIESNLEEVIRLQSLSDDLLELTNYERVNGKNVFDVVALEDVVDESIKSIQGHAKKKEIIIKKKITSANVLGNKEKLRELLIILLDNAIKYSPENSTVTIETTLKSKSVTLRVKDEGLGIASEDLPFIFERFYRADTSRSKQIDGFGLGLSIAKKIVTLHNGTIIVKSELQKGTTFVVSLPLKK